MSQTDRPVWFITGCSTGFGRELARLVLDRGWRAVVTARNPSQVADLVQGHEGNALALKLDVTNAGQIAEAAALAQERFGQVDVLVNNAGYGYLAAIEEGEDAEVRAMLEANFFGLAAMTRALLPGMRARRSGHIVNISSIGGLASFPTTGYYHATKYAIEAQIQRLKSELQRVRRDLEAQNSEARAARKDAAQARAEQARLSQTPAPARQPSGAPDANLQVGAEGEAGTNNSPAESTAPASTSALPGSVKLGGVSFPQNRPTLTSSDGRASVAVGLQLHYDVGGYFQGSNRPDSRSMTRLNTFGENLRRARVPFVFKYDDFPINVTPDFGGGSPDGTPSLYEANFDWSPIQHLVATLGYYKPQLTLQDSMSSNDFLFLERPAIVDIAHGIAGGDSRAVVGARWAAGRYFIASYLTGGSVGSQTVALAQPQQTGAVLRLAGRAVATDDWDVHGGFSVSDAFRIQRTGAGQTLTLQERLELRIDQNRLITTGALNARSAYEYGPEFGLRWRNFMLQGEYIRIGVDRTNGGATVRTPGLEFSGGYAEASWVITGEPRRYVAAAGAFGSPRPAREFSLKDGGYGAFELVAHYSRVDLNDRVTRALAASTTGGVYGGTQDIYAAGDNWYLNSQLRMMPDYDIINVDRLNTTGRTQIGRRVQAVALRAQAAF